MQKYLNSVANSLGKPVSSATVTVLTYPAGGVASIYSDNGVTPLANPTTTDSNGDFAFYAANGRYSVQISGPGIATAIVNDIELFDSADVAVSLLDFMTSAQRADAVAGSLSLDQTTPVQTALSHLMAIGGGTLDWYSVKVSGALKIQGSNITIRPRGGNKLVQSGTSYNTFLIYPTSLNSIWDGSGRPAGFSSGIDGSPETLMYESNDANRLRNIQILGLDFSYTGTGSNGRFIDAFSVDEMVVRDCRAVSASNAVSFWYCRDLEAKHNDLTGNTATFSLFVFKSYGEVSDNDIRAGYSGVEVKGCYPQAGKTIYQGFDAGYEYWNPIKVHHNRFYDIVSTICQVGYYDNSTADISSGAPVGVTKSQWYGQVWGAEVCDNTSTFTGTPGVQSNALRMNVNTRYAKYNRNTIYGGGILTFGSLDSEICGNTIINSRISSTAAIEICGFTTGAVSRNSQNLIIAKNRISGHARNAIYLRGVDYSNVEENFIQGCTATGFNQIRVDSTNSSTTSTGNHITRNRVIYAANDFAYPIQSTGANSTVIEGNRAYGGWYNGNALDSDGFADNHYKRGVVSADTPTSYVGSAGTCYVGQNFGDQNATTPETGYANEMALNGTVGGGWRQAMRFGTNSLWGAALGNVRFKTGSKASSDTDGAPLGRKVAVPATVSTAGLPGDWAADTSNFYTYTGDGTTHSWRRVAIAAF